MLTIIRNQWIDNTCNNSSNTKHDGNHIIIMKTFQSSIISMRRMVGHCHHAHVITIIIIIMAKNKSITYQCFGIVWNVLPIFSVKLRSPQSNFSKQHVLIIIHKKWFAEVQIFFFASFCVFSTPPSPSVPTVCFAWFCGGTMIIHCCGWRTTVYFGTHYTT